MLMLNTFAYYLKEIRKNTKKRKQKMKMDFKLKKFVKHLTKQKDPLIFETRTHKIEKKNIQCCDELFRSTSG